MAKKHDNFLADAITAKETKPHISYWDGFRFGVGFFLSGVVMSLILGGLAWAIVAAFHMH